MDAELLLRNIVAHWLQSGVLAVSAFAAVRLLNLNEPRAKLAALHLVLLAIVLLPLVQPWRVESVPPQMASSATAVDVSTVISGLAAGGEPAVAPWFNPARDTVAIAAAGIVMRLLWLFYGIVALARFSRGASDISTPAAASELEADLQVSPRYIQQTGTRGPWTFGFFRPTVALPAGFNALVPAFQRAVICHELVHVKRRDIAVAFVEELAVAALWFHPWIWLLRARIRVAREQVVDSQVVAMLDNRDEYVRCLVDISGHDLAPHFSQAGAGMLRPCELRARVDAIFQEVHMSRMRLAAATLSFVSVTVATGLIAVAAMPLRAASLVPTPTSNEPLPLLVSRYLIADASSTAISWSAAAQSQRAPAAPRKQMNRVYPEYPRDALEGAIKGVVIVDITVNAAGDVSTAAVASGPQELRASAFKAALGMRYTPGPSTTAMQITFEYVLTGTTWGVKIGEALPNMGLRPMPQNTGAATRPLVMTSRGPADPMPEALRVGSDIRPPKKIRDMPPVYPAEAQEARVQGVVIMDARIDENGSVSHTHVLRSIPLLDQAAIDAVKQWQYTPTLMNGVAVPVVLTTTVNFTLRDVTPSSLIRLQMLFSDGRTLMEGEVQSDVPILIDVPRIRRFHLKASRSRDSSDVTVSFFGEDGQQHLGSVVLRPDSPPVQSPTIPSFGVQLLGVR